ncbi:hypothetical protein [Malonomonas rubra]|uniref:hypothetical protein n=1 Tax=Malonomonas rubra TaxID=57040 RepID=UPI0026F0CB24|nr:hypothetical protein [Malonomonas rubra]
MMQQSSQVRSERNDRSEVIGTGTLKGLVPGLIVLFCLALLFNALLWLLPPADLLGVLKRFAAGLPDWLFDVGGLRVMLEHVELHMLSTQWTITPECAVLSAGLVFVVFVLVFPTTKKAKKNALIFGLPLLLIANLIRWWSLVWSGDLLLWKTNFFYDYIGLVIFVLLVALVWFVGIERSIKYEV